MARDIYWNGHAAGSEAAGLSPVAIQVTTDGNDLAALAGNKLESAIRRRDGEAGFEPRSESWKVGFFDGFMQRAEEIIRGR